MTKRSIRRIGILTGGGDCPGLNAVIRAVAKTALFEFGLEVFGVENGYLGLIRNTFRRLAPKDVSNILTVGGTILGTSNKANPGHFCTGEDENGKPIFRDVSNRVVEHVREQQIDALICIGGDGTMTGSRRLIENGIPCVGVPKTIDNDLVQTDLTFGFSTAVQTATDAIDRLHTTAASHHRVMVVEVMGRNAGWVALHAGVAGGADVILMPEMPFDMGVVADFCLDRRRKGKSSTIIAVSEGARLVGGDQIVREVISDSPDPIGLGGIASYVAKEIETRTRLETRATVLGHVQRGGSPCAFDRVLATQFGHAAIQHVDRGEFNRVVVMQGGKITSVPIDMVADQQRLVPADDPTLAAARGVDTCFGEPETAIEEQVQEDSRTPQLTAAAAP